MKRTFLAWTGRRAITILAAGLLAAAPLSAQEPTRHASPRFGDGEPRRAEPRSAPAPPTPTPAPAPAPSAGASGGDHAVVRSGGDRDATTGSSSTASAPQGRRREGRTPVGTAVARPAAPAASDDGKIVPGYTYGYYPWGSGGLGFGHVYDGFYDPFYDPWYSGYWAYPQGGSYPSGFEGALRLKVKPREAEVYVDGYYVGIVDNFDGIFQRLHVEAGPHRIEIRAPGYETVVFDVRIQPDRTTTYEGKLRAMP